MTDPTTPRLAAPVSPLRTPGAAWQGRGLIWLLRDRTLIAICTLALPLVVGIVLLSSRRTWTSSASFMPATRRAASNLSGLAAQFGINVPTTEPSQSPAFYADLVMSRALLGAIADSSYSFTSDTGEVRGTLVDIVVKDHGLSPSLRREEAFRWLRDHLVATPYARTGTIGLTVVAPAPVFAQQLLQRAVQGINRFNLETRQSQAGAERRFTERRLEEAKHDLRSSEDALQAFMQSNRDYERATAPRLQYDRLSRDVTFRQQLLTSIAQAFEQAHIDEVRDTPAITVIDEPNVPARPNGRGTVAKTFGALVAGLLLGCVLAAVRGFRSNDVRPVDVPGHASQLLEETLEDCRHPVRWIGRAIGRVPAT